MTKASDIVGCITTAASGPADLRNDAKGLTAGAYDEKSGLTGLALSNFSAEAGENGNLVMKRNGDEEVNFSDIGNRNAAADLGFASGYSQGLTLQIGDTGDSFRKLNVSIANLRVNSMKLNGMDAINNCPSCRRGRIRHP